MEAGFKLITDAMMKMAERTDEHSTELKALRARVEKLEPKPEPNIYLYGVNDSTRTIRALKTGEEKDLYILEMCDYRFVKPEDFDENAIRARWRREILDSIPGTLPRPGAAPPPPPPTPLPANTHACACTPPSPVRASPPDA